MLTLYKKIWVDAITQQKNKKGDDVNWKSSTMISMSILEGLNLLSLLFIIRWLTHGTMPIVLPLSIFNVKYFNTAISIVITFFIPFLIINYLLVFQNERYKVLLNSYPPQKGKLYGWYAIISIGIIVVPLVFKLLF